MKKKIAYWIATALLAFAYLAGGAFDLAQPEPVVEGAAKLGYPLHFFSILGFWKVAGGLAILLPGLARVKEWAYAGIGFNLTAAIATHLFIKDPITEIIMPLILLGIAVTSWALRSASRKLAGSWL